MFLVTVFHSQNSGYIIAARDSVGTPRTQEVEKVVLVKDKLISATGSIHFNKQLWSSFDEPGTCAVSLQGVIMGLSIIKNS